MIRDLIKSISRKEWYFVIAIALFIILLTTLPYIYGWAKTPSNYTYTGLHSLTPGDIHVYFSWMEQVKQGYFISKDLYTSEPQSRILLNSFWSLEGLIALLTGLSNYMVFQLTRIFLIPLFSFILYLVSAYFWKEVAWRKICFIFFSFASGLGVVASLFATDNIYTRGWYNWPLDMWAPEGNNLLTMFQSPHFILSTSLIIIIFFLMFLAFEKNITRYAVWAGISGLFLFQFHPFHVPTIFGVLGVYVLIQFMRSKRILFSYLKQAFIFAFLSAPSIIYWLWLSKYDFVTQIRTYQNVTLTPTFFITFMSYGFIIILALWAIYKIFKSKKISNQNIFLITWLIVQFALMYSPLAFQRRLMQGMQIPMILLAVLGVHFIYDYLKTKMSDKSFDFIVNNQYLFILLFILLFTSSNIYNWIREIAVFSRTYPQFYVHNDKIAGYTWLQKNTPPDTVILSDLYSGNLIPGRIGRKVYVGHGVETLFFDSKVYDMVWFYANNIVDDRKIEFLKRGNIDYVFYSDNEKGIGEYRPSEKNYLKRIFKQGDVEIYQVDKTF